jgi:hypothetical protein
VGSGDDDATIESEVDGQQCTRSGWCKHDGQAEEVGMINGQGGRRQGCKAQ